MSEYKRKKVRRSPKKKVHKKSFDENELFFEEEEALPPPKKEKTPKPKKVKREPVLDTTETEEAEASYKRRNFRVIDKKEKKTKKIFKTLGVTAILVCAILLASYLLPGGIIESVSGFFASVGNGEYPIEYSGSLIVDSYSLGSCNFLLNDTSLTVFNNNGKELFKHQHGFSNPIMYTSDTRALVIDEGGDTAYVYTKSGLAKTVNTGSKIINGAIGQNGNFAISCVGTEYTSSVFVYNKKGKKIYTWNSAKDIINSLAVSRNGKKIAVSCLNVQNGIATNKLYVLGYSSADPVFSKDFESQIILAMRTGSYGFACITENGYTYFSWNKYSEVKHTVEDKKLSLFRKNGGQTLLVFNRSSDKTDNRIVLLSSLAKVKGEFDYNGTITDIQFKNNRIYIVSGTSVSVFNKKGELLHTATIDYGTKRFYVISSNRLCLIMDDKIEKITIK